MIFSATLAFANPAALAAPAFSVALVEGGAGLVMDLTGNRAEDAVGVFADNPGIAIPADHADSREEHCSIGALHGKRPGNFNGFGGGVGEVFGGCHAEQ